MAAVNGMLGSSDLAMQVQGPVAGQMPAPNIAIREINAEHADFTLENVDLRWVAHDSRAAADPAASQMRFGGR